MNDMDEIVERFVVNEHIDMVLDGEGVTRIYIAGRPFKICSYVLLNITLDAPGDDIDAIIANAPPESKVHEGNKAIISPKTAFFAHCSNMQAWVEHGYDTRVLDSRLSFPILRSLDRLGDEKARRVLEGEIRDRLASGHPSTIATILMTCAEYITEDIVREFVKNHPDPEGLVLLAGHAQGCIPDDIMIMLATHEEPSVRKALARRVLPRSILLLYATNEQDPEILEQLIYRNYDDLPVEMITHAISCPNSATRKTIAQWCHLDDAQMETLARDGEWVVRRNLAERQDLPEHISLILAADPVFDVRDSLLRYGKLSARIILTALKLSSTTPIQPHHMAELEATATRSITIRKQNRHVKLPRSLLHRLCRSNNITVLQRVLHLDGLTSTMLIDVFKGAMTSNTLLPVGFIDKILDHPLTPPILLELMASTPETRGRLKVKLAKHDRTPPKILEILCTTGDLFVKEIIARRHDLTPSICKMLAADGAASPIRDGLLYNPVVPREIKLSLTRQAFGPTSLQTSLNDFIGD